MVSFVAAHPKIGGLIAIIAAASLFLSACSGFGSTDVREAEARGIGLHPEGTGRDAALDPALVEAQNRFAMNLYRQLARAGATDTAGVDGVFISPASIALALTMAYNGALGETAENMARALELGGLSLDEVNDAYYALIKSLARAAEDDPGVELRIANSIWQREGYPFKEDFLIRNRRFFGARVDSLDFDDPGAAGTINDWVSRWTEGRIEGSIEQISPDTIMFLVNAIYFKGDWATPFDPAATRPAPFYRPGGSPVEVPLMRRDGGFAHYEGDGFQAVRLPYGGSGGDESDGESSGDSPGGSGDGGRLAMYVFLPDEGSDLDSFQQQLTYDNWQHWLGGFRQKFGQVALPRFRMEYKADLKRALGAMGMNLPFDGAKADFGAMTATDSGPNVYISDVIHQTFLEVNESGSEAAGATLAGVDTTSAPMYDFEFTADRPFFAAIVDDETGTLLFAGSVINPEPVE